MNWPRCCSDFRPVCCFTGCCDGLTGLEFARELAPADSPAAARAARRCLLVSRATSGSPDAACADRTNGSTF
jgi:hypothetical protein